MNKFNLQIITAAVLALGGLVLLFCGVYIDPAGEIHESLLIGFGEVATFAGALFGIDATYKFKYKHIFPSHGKEESPLGRTASKAIVRPKSGGIGLGCSRFSGKTATGKKVCETPIAEREWDITNSLGKNPTDKPSEERSTEERRNYPPLPPHSKTPTSSFPPLSTNSK